MSKKKIIIISCITILAIVLIILITKLFTKIQKEEKIKNATIIVELNENLDIPFNEPDIHISNFIKYINGTIKDDYLIDTTELGEKEIKFEYTNDENILVPYSFNINIKDTTPPLVWLSNTYNIETNFKGTLTDKILCADNYDDKPTCIVEGEYKTDTEGTYNLTFVAVDSSDNKTEIPFTLNVTKPSNKGSSNTQNPYPFKEMYDKFKTDDTLIGIDVSFWQGDINFEALKEAGVEFAFIRVGSMKKSTREYFTDTKFKQNLEGFKRVGIPVGAYFYTYAKNEEDAINDAKYVLKELDSAKLDLPIAFDFEDWSHYNEYGMSLYKLNKNAEAFIKTIEEAGYKGMLYGSLNYLNKIWDTKNKTVWVAHYTTKADYKDKYSFWQFTANGQVPGISGAVDLDIMYK